VLALSETGVSSNSAAAVSIMGFSYAESEFGGLQARAIADAVQSLAHEIRVLIGGESSHVISISGNEVVIDIGSTLGAKEGSLYLVYADGRTLRSMSGEIIGHEKIPLAVVKVRDISSAHSTCTVAPPSESKMIRRGDKVEPITASKAKGTKFATSRPAASSKTFDEAFSDSGSVADNRQTSQKGNNIDNRLADIASDSGVSTTTNTGARSGGRKTIPGFDPDNSTDGKVIQTYNLDPGAANMLSIRHRNAVNKFNSGKFKDAYADFCAMADEYDENYLAAYWAGVTAHRLRKNAESLEWIEEALFINPNYKPAADFKRKTLKK
jgi:TolA-binding protein